MSQTNLATFNNSWYKTGASALKRGLWHCFNFVLLHSFIPGSAWRIMLLRLFGASIGKHVVIKPKVKIKYPWLLTIDNYSWIGEEVWIDNLAQVTIGEHVCISQGALLICGNHNYKKTSFDLQVAPITVQAGVWIGAKSTIAPGTNIGSHAVIGMSSAVNGTILPYSIYKGNPAVKIADRIIS